jgi:hypothetical protein
LKKEFNIFEIIIRRNTMIRNRMHILFIVLILLPTGFTHTPHIFTANQETGDDHWADDLTMAGFDNIVYTLASDRQGNIYAGGDFTSFGGMPVNHIARWDGSAWSALGNGINKQVHHLAVDSTGNLYTDVLVTDSGMPETLVMRWDGSTWSPLPGNLSGLVDTLAEGRDSNIIINDLVVNSQDQLYAGGYFYLIQSDRYVGFVARWDGSAWTLLGNGMNHTVYHLAVDGQDYVYAGGEFTLAGGVPANRIARWDGNSWNALGSGLGGDYPTIADMEADHNSNVYVTGQFDTAGDTSVQLIARWDGSAWSELAPGTRSGWFEGEFGSIFDLSVSPNGDLYAGGSFRIINGVEAHNIARWDGASWTALSTPAGNGVNERVYAVTIDEKEQVFAGGFFTNAGGLPANHIARWDGTAWFTWMKGGESGIDNIVDALAVDRDGVLYAGGYFTTAGKAPANHIARWDGKEWSPLGKGLDASVRDLAVDSRGNLYAGGTFTTAGDVNANRIARWDGTTWSALDEGVSAEHTGSPEVWALAVDDQGNLYAGGDFTTAGGIEANYIARWDGTTWSALGRGMDEQVTDLAVDPQGNLYAAGWFKRAGDVEASGVARWDGSSWSALGNALNMGGAIEIGKNGEVYATGMFFIPPDSNGFTQYIARWDGSTWNPLGEGVDNFVNALAVDPEGNLFAAGDFTSAGGMPALRIARWDGSSWFPLGSGLGAEGDYSSISMLAVDDSGNLYVGGQFTLAGNKPSAYLAKWCAELEAGVCTFRFVPIASTPQPTLIPTTQVSLPTATLLPENTEPAATVTKMSTGELTTAAPGISIGALWIGVVVLIILLGGLSLIFSRRIR